jgi:hypothetical protein
MIGASYVPENEPFECPLVTCCFAFPVKSYKKSRLVIKM